MTKPNQKQLENLGHDLSGPGDSATVLTGPDALGAEYSSLTITASTTVDSVNNTATLNINQINDQADSLRAGFTILPMGATNNSKISWNPNNITL